MKKQRRRAATGEKRILKKPRGRLVEHCIIPSGRWQFEALSRISDFEIAGMGGTGTYMAKLLSGERGEK